MGGIVFLPCWLFGLRHPSIGTYRLLGGARSSWENGGLQESSWQRLLSRTIATVSLSLPWAIAAPCLYRRPSDTSRWVWSRLFMSQCFSPWVPVYTMSCGNSKSTISISCVILVIKPHWSSKPCGLGAPLPIARHSDWEALHGAQNFHSYERNFLIELFSHLWVTHLVGMGFDFTTVAPLLSSHGYFFGCRISFW